MRKIYSKAYSGSTMHFDAHIHSAASPDSEMAPHDVIQTLEAKGLGTVFTEHADFATPTTGRDFTATDAPKATTDFICDFSIYPSTYRHLRKDTVLLGIEIGLNAAFLELNTQTADQDYDFVLGSIHSVDGDDVFLTASKSDADYFCRRYLTYAREMVELCGFFDSFAHIDYPARYGDKVNKRFQYKIYPNEFDALLRAIADRGLAMEINTSRFGNDSVIGGQLAPIYKRFNELGGKYVTIGSDAHTPWALGRYYNKAIGLADIAKLAPVYFNKRERRLCK